MGSSRNAERRMTRRNQQASRTVTPVRLARYPFATREYQRRTTESSRRWLNPRTPTNSGAHWEALAGDDARSTEIAGPEQRAAATGPQARLPDDNRRADSGQGERPAGRQRGRHKVSEFFTGGIRWSLN